MLFPPYGSQCMSRGSGGCKNRASQKKEGTVFPTRSTLGGRKELENGEEDRKKGTLGVIRAI